MRRIILGSIILTATLLFCVDAWAEMWPNLDNYVSRCVLIVKAKTVFEGSDKRLTFKVLESWKGKYHPDLFKYTKPDGRFIEYQGHHGINVVDGQEIVFFFTRDNNPSKGPMISHSTAFPVKNGKVVYASTSDWLRKEYWLKDFKKSIISLVKKQKQKKNSEQANSKGRSKGCR